MPTPKSSAGNLLGNLPNPKEVAAKLDEYHKALNMLEPVVNQFHRAFGTMSELQQTITETKNAIVKAKTVLNE